MFHDSVIFYLKFTSTVYGECNMKKYCVIVKTESYSGITLMVDDDFDEDSDSPILKKVLKDFPKESRRTIFPERDEVEMIMVGWFDEFESRDINAFYKDGALYISNIQDSAQDMYDDIIHELSHSLEGAHGYEIYGDQKIKEEFLRKI